MADAHEFSAHGHEPQRAAAWICRQNILNFQARLATAEDAEQRTILAELLEMEQLRLTQIAAAQQSAG